MPSATAMPDLGGVVTLGRRTARWPSRLRPQIRVEAPAIATVDTTGAGDAFVGVLAAMLDAGSSATRRPEKRGRRRDACVHPHGAQPALPDRAAIDALVAQLQR